MIKKKRESTMHSRKWIAAAVAAVMGLSPLAVPVYAAVSEEGRYENRYDTSADLGTFKVTTGGPENGSLELNTSVSPYPDEPSGVAEMRLTKGSLSAVEANFNQEFKDHPVHNFTDAGVATTVELKIRFSQKGNVKKALRLDDAVNNVAGDYLAEFDDGRIYSTSSSGHILLAGSVETPCYSPGSWYQLFAVLRGNTYDLYFGGQKLNSEPLKVSNAALKSVSRVVNNHKTWSDESSYFDDLILQPLTGLELQRSTVEDGEEQASEKLKKIVLDFNTPLDRDSIAQIVLLENGTPMPAESYTVSADGTDMTRATITIHDSLSLSTSYEISYAGLGDLLGSVSDGSLRFTTRDTPSPAELERSDPENGAVNVPVSTTVSASFNKEIDPASLSPDCVTVTPNTPVESVTLEAGKTVRVTFAKPLKPNRSYRVSFSGQIRDLEDGLNVNPAEISFTTVQNPDMVIDEFEWLTEGLHPAMIGISDKNGSVVAADTITDPKNQLPYSIDILNPENYNGDTSRIFMGMGADDSRLIYRIDEGVRDVTLSIFDNLNTTTEGAIYRLEFAAAKTMDDLNDTSTYVDVTSQVVKEQLSLSAKDGFYPFRYTYRPEYASYPYFIIRMRRITPNKSSWTPKIANVQFNSILPDVAQVETLGESNVVQLSKAGHITVPFTAELEEESVRPSYFEISGAAVTDAVLDSTGSRVELSVQIPVEYSRTYDLSVGEGLTDIYGRAVSGGSYTLISPHPAELVSASLAEGEGLPASGAVTPAAVINCLKAGTDVTVYAVYYQGDRIAGISTLEKKGMSSGTTTLTLPQLNITDNGPGCRVELFARTDGFRPLPGSHIFEDQAERSDRDEA